MKKLIFIVFIGTFSFLTLSSKETTAFESTYDRVTAVTFLLRMQEF
ncbi:MAG: hypothetical protein Ct9H300mP3_11430 [Gammaproteobacteria bacterium]|nr:MAG: hypothetical protein Ct9H300mP3_11430 [Gammaproteobacteria bacterium]